MKGWIQHGWIHTRKIKMGSERWLVWADDDELVRLQKLRNYRRPAPSIPYPPELTTPHVRSET
jgi:hypothetical protein